MTNLMYSCEHDEQMNQKVLHFVQTTLSDALVYSVEKFEMYDISFEVTDHTNDETSGSRILGDHRLSTCNT